VSTAAIVPARAAGERVEGFDAVVIGAGIGGLAAAALLAHRGQRVLVVEALEEVGGRGSTRDVDGFKISTGAVALELGGSMQAIFDEVGARYEVRQPSPAVVVRTRGRMINTTSPLARAVIDGVLRRGGAMLTRRWPAPVPPGPGAADAGDGDLGERTLEQWLGRLGRIDAIRRLARNVAAGVFSVNSDELPARAVLTYLTQHGAFRTYGFAPAGTAGPMRELAAVVERCGGAVWLRSRASSLMIAEGRVRAVRIVRDGKEVVVACGAVISNAGPAATIALCPEGSMPSDYVELVRRRIRPTPMFAINFAAPRPLLGSAGIVFFADTERVCAVSHLTSVCPEVAPPGWSLYVAHAVPVPALGEFDEDAERALCLRDLRREIPGFGDARVISAPLLQGDWPAQRVVTGSEIDSATPIANLWNVGDATRAPGNGGLQACAENGREVAERVLVARPTAR
jgi:phytoene desaturase